jgi:uncharacterized protein YbjT (DUF2867 family)
MILITGGTGFIGRVLVRKFQEEDQPIRLILRPSRKSPALPPGVQLEVAISNLNESRNLRVAMVGVDTVYHLAGVEHYGAYGDLVGVDIRGTQAVVDAAVDAGVDRFFYVSHLGVDRSSAYPVLKAKAIAEEQIRKSGIDYTTIRSGIVYGKNDAFTSGLASLLSVFPFLFFMPGEGGTLLQPLWVEDLVTCLLWALDESETRMKTYEIGGPEQLTFKQICKTVMEKLDIQRRLVKMHPSYLRGLTVFLDTLFPGLPVSVFWLDYLAANRTCALDSVPRSFNLLPSRFSHQIDYLKDINWQGETFKKLLRRR